MSNEIMTTVQSMPVVAGFGSAEGFELLQRQAKMLSSSALVPKEYQGNMANCCIALEMSNRMGANPLMVMQNLYIVHGKPGWSSQFLIAALNSTNRFTPLRFQITGEGDAKTCIAWATEKANDERLESPPVSIEMAKKEGWFEKNGSKWKTMPELMLRYRAATFFCRLYAPEVTMGFQTAEEVQDVIDVTPQPTTNAQAIMERFTTTTETAETPTGEIPITAEENAEVQAVDNSYLLQAAYAKITALAEKRGDTADDTVDTLTKGKVGIMIGLEDKTEAYIKGLMLLVDAEMVE